MDQEAADELNRFEPHHLHAIAALDAIGFPAECHGVRVGTNLAVVRDREAVSVSAEISKYGFGSAEGRFGIDHPIGFAQRREMGLEGIRVGQL